MAKDTSKPRIHSAITYKLNIISCLVVATGLVLMLKFPETHFLEAGVDPPSLTVYGLSMKVCKIMHFLLSIAFLVFTGLHIYFNREWVKKVGSRKLNLPVTVGLLIGVLILLAGLLAPGA